MGGDAGVGERERESSPRAALSLRSDAPRASSDDTHTYAKYLSSSLFLGEEREEAPQSSPQGLMPLKAIAEEEDRDLAEYFAKVLNTTSHEQAPSSPKEGEVNGLKRSRIEAAEKPIGKDRYAMFDFLAAL